MWRHGKRRNSTPTWRPPPNQTGPSPGSSRASPELNEDRVRTILQDNLAASPQWFGMSAAFEPNGLTTDAPGFAIYYCREPGGGRGLSTWRGRTAIQDLDWYRPARETGGRILDRTLF